MGTELRVRYTDDTEQFAVDEEHPLPVTVRPFPGEAWPLPTGAGIGPVLKDDNLTVGATAVGFTNADLNLGAVMAICNVETAPIRITEDGRTAPTATVGTVKNAGDSFVIVGRTNIQNFQAIRTTGTSGSLGLQFIGPNVPAT